MKSVLPLLVLVALGVGVWVSGLTEYLGWHELARHQASLLALVAAWPVLAPIAYVAIYAAFVALSVPQAVVVTISGGLLFGTILGGALAVLGATLGAVILFFLARSAFGDSLASRGGAFVAARSGTADRSRAAVPAAGRVAVLEETRWPTLIPPIST